MSETVKLSSYLSPQQRLALLQHSKLGLVLPELAGDLLSIKGCKELTSQVRHSCAVLAVIHHSSAFYVDLGLS